MVAEEANADTSILELGRLKLMAQMRGISTGTNLACFIW